MALCGFCDAGRVRETEHARGFDTPHYLLRSLMYSWLCSRMFQVLMAVYMRHLDASNHHAVRRVQVRQRERNLQNDRGDESSLRANISSLS